MSRIGPFLAWLKMQEGSAYVWGAEGHVVRDGKVFLSGRQIAADWQEWVRGRETEEANAKRAIRFIQKKLDAGAQEVTCYDCSGLIMRYLRAVAGYLESDMTARGLFACCEEIRKNELAAGDLLFRHNGQKIIHVGVYLGFGQTIESRGRDAGVVIRDIDSSGGGYWNRFGTLPLLLLEDAEQHAAAAFGLCAGGSVYLRSGPTTGNRALAVAHRGDRLLAFPPENGWCKAAVCAGGELVTGYMSAKYIENI